MLKFLDIFFIVFHTLFTLFNMFGWIWKKTRRIHLITAGLTLFSWFVLGIWYGWGYCLCTDWHWQVREALGDPVIYHSYIQFLVAELTGIVPNLQLTEWLTLIIFIISIAMSLYLNLRPLIKHKSK
jgi:hypothetical protein